MKRPVGALIVSLLLCAVSIGGLLTLPSVLFALQTPMQYLVAVCHVTYVVTGILVSIGIWRLARSTWIAVVIWAIASLGAALGGPLAFVDNPTPVARTLIAVTITIVFLSSGLLWFVRRMTHTKT